MGLSAAESGRSQLRISAFSGILSAQAVESSARIRVFLSLSRGTNLIGFVQLITGRSPERGGL
jgi:hypothetical protein